MRRFKLAAASSALLLMLAGMAAAGFAGSDSPFSATFDGAPTQPAPFVSDHFDVQVHSRDADTWVNPEAIAAQHGSDCAAPPATHPVSTYEGEVFGCANHLMTAINASGYGVIYLTPDQMVDLAGTATVKFDLSTLRMSTRDWVDVWITPYADNLALPFDQGDVDLQGVPRTGVHVIMSEFSGQTTWRAYTIKNFVETEVAGGCWWCGEEGALNYTPTGAQRESFQLTLSAGHLRFEMLPSAGTTGVVWADTNIPALGFTAGVVQFGHHSYNPFKDGAGTCTPGDCVTPTWHWDNISISPSIPFTMIHAGQRFTQGGTVSFAAPAPSGASLRFAANGANVQVSFNGGATWTNAHMQAAEKNVDRFKNYFTPIPEGVSTVQFRGDATFNGPFFAQDMTLWSLASRPAPSTATSSATATPSPTATPLPPTASPTVGSSPTASPPTSTPTMTPVLSPTPTPEPTITAPPPPACRMAVFDSAGRVVPGDALACPSGVS